MINLFIQELFTSEQFTGKQFLRVKIERRITILCEEHFHIGPQVHKMDRSISKLLEARVKAEGLDEVTLMHGWIDLSERHREVFRNLPFGSDEYHSGFREERTCLSCFGCE